MILSLRRDNEDFIGQKLEVNRDRLIKEKLWEATVQISMLNMTI